MYTLHGSQKIHVYEEKKIIESSAVGDTNVEEVRWLEDRIMEYAAEWKETGWGYIAGISELAPVPPDVSAELIEFHKKLEQAGCKAVAFVKADAFVISVQAKKHQRKSKASYKEEHFRTEEEAFAWVEKILSKG